MSCYRWLASMVPLVYCVLLSACDKNDGQEQKQVRDETVANKADQANIQADSDPDQIEKRKRTKKPEPEEMIKTSFLRSDSPTAAVARHPGLSELAAINKVTAAIAESTQSGPTLVIWILDQSESASRLVSGVQAALISFYEQFGAGKIATGSANNLFTAVVAFGGNVQFLVEYPTSDINAVTDALKSFEGDSSGKELTFAAVQETLRKYKEYRTRRRYQLMVVIVTDESGDDRQLIGDIIESPDHAPRRLGIPIYVIGPPAPFGREVGLKGSREGKSVRQGPESRESERIRLAFWGSSYGVDLIDSGFGPFELEWLCRDSGGLFLAIRPEFKRQRRFKSQFDNEWPSLSAGRFDPQAMRKYAPAYESERSYRAKIEANQAKQALLNAAKIRRTDIDKIPPIDFVITTEARLQNEVTAAQRVAAQLEPEVDRFYEVLKVGEDDRDKLTEPRWQAGFDLAMGRVMAAKARVEGYNEMLAALKRGKKFENPDSNRWYLESASITVDAGSGLKKLGERARTYLQRVVDEHPGTPWAKIAAEELKSDIGWKWVEKGPSN